MYPSDDKRTVKFSPQEALELKKMTGAVEEDNEMKLAVTSLQFQVEMTSDNRHKR